MAFINQIEIIMKHFSRYSFLALVTLFSNAQAATIYEIQSDVSAYANNVVNSSENFYDQNFNGDIDSLYIDPGALSTAVTGSSLETYAFTNVFHETGTNNGYITLNFGIDIYNGAGADLVLFFAGNGSNLSTGIEPYKFSIDVGNDGTYEGGLLGVTTSTTSGIGGDFFASYAMIDLDTFDGFDQTTALGDIRIYLGDSSMPSLAALGAYHTTAVPLPLSSVLFGSGLALLSLFRRKKSI